MNDDDLLSAAGKLQRSDEARSATPRGQALEAPLDDAFRRRLKGRLVDSLAENAAQATDAAARTSEGSPTAAEGGKVLRGRFGRAGGWLAPLALAAGLIFFLLPQTSLEPLPSYDLELRGYVQQERSSAASAPQDIPELLPSSVLELVLRPASAVDESLEVSALALSEHGKAQELRFDVQISDQGAVQLRSRVGDLGLEAGNWTLVVAAARSGQTPDLDALATIPSSDGVVVLRQPVRILLPAVGND